MVAPSLGAITYDKLGHVFDEGRLVFGFDGHQYIDYDDERYDVGDLATLVETVVKRCFIAAAIAREELSLKELRDLWIDKLDANPRLKATLPEDFYTRALDRLHELSDDGRLTYGGTNNFITSVICGDIMGRTQGREDANRLCQQLRLIHAVHDRGHDIEKISTRCWG